MITFKSISYHRGKIKRVYLAEGLENAKQFAHKFSGTYFEYFPDVYMVIIS